MNEITYSRIGIDITYIHAVPTYTQAYKGNMNTQAYTDS